MCSLPRLIAMLSQSVQAEHRREAAFARRFRDIFNFVLEHDSWEAAWRETCEYCRADLEEQGV